MLMLHFDKDKPTMFFIISDPKYRTSLTNRMERVRQPHCVNVKTNIWISTERGTDIMCHTYPKELPLVEGTYGKTTKTITFFLQ